MTDYIDTANALIVDSDEEYCSWSHDPRNELTTTRHRVSWSALSKAFVEGHRIASDEPLQYLRMSESARSTMEGFCTDQLVGDKLNSFLGLGRALDSQASSELMRLSAAV
jgi:hypothetical protein